MKLDSIHTFIAAIRASASAEGCVDAILGFAGALTDKLLEEYELKGKDSALGKELLDRDLFPSFRWLSTETDKNRLEQLLHYWSAGQMLRDLYDYFTRVHNPEVKKRSIDLLEELITQWSMLADGMNSFFLCSMPDLEKTAGADVIDSLKNNVAAVKKASVMGSLADSPLPVEMYHLKKKRASMEKRYLDRACAALRSAASVNSIVAESRMISSVPPWLCRKFWDKEGFSRTDGYAPTELAGILAGIQRGWNDEGFAHAEKNAKAVSDGFLRLALDMLVRGYDRMQIENSLATRKDALIHHTSVLHRLCLKGALWIQSGVNPHMMDQLGVDLSQIGDYRVTPVGFIDLIVSMAEKARREGLLSLEDDLSRPEGVVMQKIEGQKPEKDALSKETTDSWKYHLVARSAMANSLMKKGLKMVIDGNDPGLVRDALRWISDHEVEAIKKYTSIIVQGILEIQCGENPDFVKENLRQHETGADALDGIAEVLKALAESVRFEGMKALDRAEIKNQYLANLVRLVMAGTPPETISEIGETASRMILDEIGLRCDLCITSVRFFFEIQDSGAYRALLEEMIPFHCDAGTTAEFRELSSNSLEQLKRMRKQGGTAGKKRNAFPLSIAAHGELWDCWFGFRNFLREKLSLAGALAPLFSSKGINTDSLFKAVEDSLEELKVTHRTKRKTSLPSRPLYEYAAELVSVKKEIRNKALAEISDLRELTARLDFSLQHRIRQFTRPETSSTIDIIDMLDRIEKNDARSFLTKVRELEAGLNNDIDAALKNLFSGAGFTYYGKYEGGMADIVQAHPEIFRYSDRIAIFGGLLKKYGTGTGSPATAFLGFSDLALLGKMDIMKVLREVDTQDLAKALARDSGDVGDLVMSCMSERAAGLLREDMKYMGPISRYDSRESQRKIVWIAAKLQSEDELHFPVEKNDGGAEASPETMKFSEALASLTMELEKKSVRKGYEALDLLLNKLENRYGFKVARSHIDYSFRRQKSDAGNPDEESKILGELYGERETDMYERPLLPSHLLLKAGTRARVQDFEDLALLTGQSLAAVVRETPPGQLTAAMHGAGGTLMSAVIGCMNSVRAGIFNEELSMISPDAAQVSQARDAIMKLVFRLEGAGYIRMRDDA